MTKYYINTEGLIYTRNQLVKEIKESKKQFYSLTDWKNCLKQTVTAISLDEAKKERMAVIDASIGRRMERSGLC